MIIIQLFFQILAILCSTVSAIILAYIEWSPEAERSGQLIRADRGGANSRKIQEALDGRPYKSDRWYIAFGVTLLLIGVVFQMCAIGLGL
jgi:hypothetical protein